MILKYAKVWESAETSKGSTWCDAVHCGDDEERIASAKYSVSSLMDRDTRSVCHQRLRDSNPQDI